MIQQYTKPTRAKRIDWNQEKQGLRLEDVARGILGDPPGRRGENTRHLWYVCPFHADTNPSFCITPGKRRWKCFGCGANGDALDLVVKVRGLSIPDAMRFLTGQSWLTSEQRPATPAEKAYRPSGLPLAEASKLAQESASRLWSAEGATARAYLNGRGLTDETIRARRLGWTPGVRIPSREPNKTHVAVGITIPWYDLEILKKLNIRQPEGSRPKYKSAFEDRPRLYPDCHSVRVGKPLVIVEGEFDAMLLWQELGELAGVITLGSASIRPDPQAKGVMLRSPAWYLAGDADDAGDKAASGWPSRARRIRPPQPFKDWTDAHKGGLNLCRYWAEAISPDGIVSPEFDEYAIAEREAIRNEPSL